MFQFKHTINNSYAASSIISFFTLLTLLYLTSVEMLYHINATDFSDLSPFLLFVQNICKEMKSLQTLFIELKSKINNISKDQQCDFRENENVFSSSDMITK